MHDELPTPIREHLDRLSTAIGGRWQVVAAPKRGFSSSVIYPLQIAGQRYALRNWNWPIAATEELTAKLHFQQRLVRGWSNQSLLFSESSSLCPVPIIVDSWASGHLVAHVEDSLWSMSSWRLGDSIGWQGRASETQMESIALTLAKMHGISLADQASEAISPGWQDRIDRLRALAETDLPPARSTVTEPAIRSDSVIRRLRADGYFSQSMQWVHTQASKRLPICWIVRDTHQENWLFENETVSGVVDFGAARCDWLGWDLIRLLSSAGCKRDQRVAFIETYLKGLETNASHHYDSVMRSIEPLLDEDFWSDLDFLQNLLSAMQWRAWSIQDRHWSAAETDRWNMLLEGLD